MLSSRTGLEILMLLCALALAPLSAAAQSSHVFTAAASQVSNPPRVHANTISEYRDLSLNDKEYLKWVHDNILPEKYETDEVFFTSAWRDVTRASEQSRNEVVLVTQTSVSRMPMFLSMTREWGGPVTVAVYMEFEKGSERGNSCRDAVVRFVESAHIAQPLAISFLYALHPAPHAECDVPGGVGSGSRGAAVTREQPVRESKQAVVSGAAKSDERAFTGLRHAVSTAQGRSALWGAVGAASTSPAEQFGVRPRRTRRAPWYFRRLQQVIARSAPLDDVDGRRRDRSARTFSPCRRYHGILPYGDPNTSWRDMYRDFYPVNALRNLAWRAVPEGVFVFLADIDFVPTPTLYSELVAGKWARYVSEMRRAYFERGERRALVVPAFELFVRRGGQSSDLELYRSRCQQMDGCTHIRGHPTPRNLHSLKAALKAGAADLFHRRVFPAGHGCYSWITWLQNYDPDQPLDMEYKHPCEPYVIALSGATPRYDERYRGRGQNKVEQLTHMAWWGFDFKVLPEHFVMHMPHRSTSKPSVRRAGGDIYATPLALIRVQMQEVAEEEESVYRVTLRFPDDPLDCKE